MSDDEDEKDKLEDEKIAENLLLEELLSQKKKYVIQKLLDNLSLMHQGDEGRALSTQQILIDLIELEKTLAIFYLDDGALLERLMSLIADSAN